MHALLGLFLLAAGAAAPIDGKAALGHASSLAALGPHPWGSPRSAVAASYVAAQFRDAGLQEVRLQPFESHGITGNNVVGVLRASGPEFIVVGAHHDTAPDAPGAYDDGGGVGVLIESARVLAKQKQRLRTIVFVSFDGEEAWSTGKVTTSGSRAYIKSLGPETRHLVAAFDIEMSGWAGGKPVFHPIAYADPLRPGGYVVTPAWLMKAAAEGAAAAGARMSVGDPLISWLYQPAVRTFRGGLYGDDLSFLQAGLPALFVSDSSFTAYYPWYHLAGDTPDKLDAAALARMGQGVLGVIDALSRVTRGGPEPTWFSAFGYVLEALPLALLLAAAMAPALFAAMRSGGLALGVRLLQAALVAVLFWQHPVPAVWVLLLPLLLMASPSLLVRALGVLPLLALAGLGVAATLRDQVRGLWVAPWHIIVAVLVIALCFYRRPGAGGRAKAAPRKKAPAKRGLKKR